MKRILLATLLVTMVAAPALDAQIGNIDPSNRHAWAENGGWLDFRPAFGGVNVLPTYLTGYAWHENAGWVKLGASAGGPYANTSATNWGVNLNAVTGALSGYAWSENAGWIRMDPTYGGVSYDGMTRMMSGWAWSENLGWLHFRSTSPPAYGVALISRPMTGTVTGGGTVCAGDSSTVTVTVSGGTRPYAVSLDDGGGIQSGAGPVFTFTVRPASTTTYAVSSLTDAFSSAGAGVGSATVTVTEVPATPIATSNSPVCAGSTIALSTPTVAGATYGWTGPNGFTSALQNPTIPSATTAMAGTYSVTVNGCASAAGTTTVTVKAVPAIPAAASNSPVCTGSTIALSTPTVAGATYAWTGPNGFTSALQNPTIPSATTAMAGIYSVTASVNGCPSAEGSTAVTVNAMPTPAAASNSPVCIGSTIALSTSAVTGATYAWTGPNGFTSTARSPTIPNATTAMAGTYGVTVTVNGCAPAASTTSVTVNVKPATPTAASNSPVCAGSAIALTTPTVAGGTYGWTGPNGFTSTLQNPTIPNATTALAGTYRVTVTVNGCASAAGSTAVTVNAKPATPTAASNSPVCMGSTIALSTPVMAGATYGWTGPNGFTSTLQNPTIPNATTATAGTYSVTATVNGCASAAGSTAVTVNAKPATPTAASNSPVCEGSAITLWTPVVAGATYAWTGPNGFTSTARSPSIPNATTAMAGTYGVTVTVNGCAPEAGTTTVTVNVKPATPTASSNSPVCTGRTISLSTPTVVGATYAWTGPNGFTSTLQNPTIPSATAAMAGSYSVTSTVSGCVSLAGTTIVETRTSPPSPVAGNTGPYFEGETILLSASEVPGASYAWTGPDGFVSTERNPTIPNATAANAGSYSVEASFAGCLSDPAATNVSVDSGRWTWMGGSDRIAERKRYGIYGTRGVAAAENVPGQRNASASWRDANGNLWLFGGDGWSADREWVYLNDLWKWDGTNWTWVSGSDHGAQYGIYGTKGVGAAENVPGARVNAASWVDASGHFWLFGGNGFGAFQAGYLNDLWKWDGMTWTWVSGSNGANQQGVYGTMGFPAPGNVPGARDGAVSWTDASGNLWLLGGYGMAAAGGGDLNDLWKWDGASWTWVHGSDSPNRPGVYGTKGVAAVANVPGARHEAVAWRDATGNVWLFGGTGHSSSQTGNLNDLWKWNGLGWAWVGGADGVDQPGIYGTKGEPAAENTPSGRYGSTAWMSPSGELWLFGGYFHELNVTASLNDLWRWDGSQWTWVSGSNDVRENGVYGTKGLPAAANVPSSRLDAIGWTGTNGDLWLFGGDRRWAEPPLRNDLWRWDGTYWTWISGGDGTDDLGVYGTPHVAASTNQPGGRSGASSQKDANGNFWLFGGMGIAADRDGYLSDLWMWDGSSWTWQHGPQAADRFGNWGTMGVSSPSNVPSARRNSASWKDSLGDLWLFGGDGIPDPSRNGNSGDLWRWDGASWTWMNGPKNEGVPAIYGTKGVAAPANNPGPRSRATTWTDANGNLWLFGGAGYLNDLWKWDGTNWTWMSGSDAPNEVGRYGTKGVADPANTPGARSGAVSWTDASGNLWLFGGFWKEEVAVYLLNDLWKWDGTNWTWVSGSNAANQAGSYGSRGVPAPGNAPGARSDAVTWSDTSGTFWLFGGRGYSEAGQGELNDLWRWDGSTWTWMSGSKDALQAGTYGTKGATGPGSTPGARASSASWTDANGNLWLFGGWGKDSWSYSGNLNDLWVFSTSSCTPTWATVSAPAGLCSGLATATASVPDAGPGASYAWTIAGGTIDGGGGTREITFSAAPSSSSVVVTVVVSRPGGCSASGSRTLPVSAPPTTPTASNGGPVCAGGTITLTATTVAGAAYSWTGPNGYTSALQNPTIPNATTAMTGTYGVTATVNGCASAAGTTAVVVDPSPLKPVLTAPLNVWPGQSFEVSVPAASGVTFDWIVTNGTITAGTGTRAITITAGAAGAVAVSVSATDEVSGCVSPEASVSVPIGFLSTGFYVFAPCRLFDTRSSTGDAAAAPALEPGEIRILTIGTRCGIPTSTVRSLAVNQTVTAPSADGEVVLFRGDLSSTPITSSLSYRAGKTRANNGILELSWSGDGTIKVHNRSTGTVHFILDVNGAFQ